jgi:hypothetical protein
VYDNEKGTRAKALIPLIYPAGVYA